MANVWLFWFDGFLSVCNEIVYVQKRAWFRLWSRKKILFVCYLNFGTTLFHFGFMISWEIWDNYQPKLNANGICNYAHTDCDLYKFIVFQRIYFLSKNIKKKKRKNITCFFLLLGFMEKTAVIAHFSSDKLQNKHWLLLLIISKVLSRLWVFMIVSCGSR